MQSGPAVSGTSWPVLRRLSICFFPAICQVYSLIIFFLLTQAATDCYAPFGRNCWSHRIAYQSMGRQLLIAEPIFH